MDSYITFGVDSPDKLVFSELGCGAGLKPYGGIYAYKEPEESGNFIGWCKTEKADREQLRTGLKFSIKEDARIYTINSWADIQELLRKYPIFRTVKKDSSEIIVDIQIDYGKMSGDYDVISLSHEGFANTPLKESRLIDIVSADILPVELQHRYEIDRLLEINTSGWEVACSYIFRKEVMENIMKYSLKKKFKMEPEELFDAATKELSYKKTDEEIIQSLKGFFNDKNELLEIIKNAKKSKKNSEQFNSLMTHLKGFLLLQNKCGDDKNKDRKEDYQPFINKTAEALYQMSVNYDGFDGFKDYICKAISSVAEKPSEPKSKEGTSHLDDDIMDALLGV